MAEVTIRAATVEDIDPLLADIREADLEEMRAVIDADPYEVVFSHIRFDPLARAGLADGELVTVFGPGRVGLMGRMGTPWLIATNHLNEYPFAFLRHCRREFRLMTKGLDYLQNYVDDRNEAAKNWLTWLGFRLHEPEPYGAMGLPFRRFSMRLN